MTDAMKKPGPDHPISVAPTAGRVVVRVNGTVVADSVHARTLNEASYPPVQYVPRDDVRLDLLERTDHATHCPYKGDAAYWSVRVEGTVAENVVWSYEAPYPAVDSIAGHMAFYPSRVESIEIATT